MQCLEDVYVETMALGFALQFSQLFHIGSDQIGASELLWLCPTLSGACHMVDFSPAALIIPENIVGFYKDKETSWTVHLTFEW